MALKDLRASYLSGNIGKPDYRASIQKSLTLLAEIGDLMTNTDIKSVNIIRGGITCEFDSVPIKMFVDVNDISSPCTQAMCFYDVEGDYSRKLIQSIKTCETFFDIGANAGYYSLICGKTNPNAKIFSFEPVNHTYMKFLRNVALNSCVNIAAYNFGFSDHESTQEMYFNESESGAGSLRDIRGTGHKEKANFIRLDDFIDENNIAPDVMKIDVEGSELFVLRGGEKFLREKSPVIFIEILRKWCRAFGHEASEVFNLLHNMGYTGHVVRGSELEVIDEMREDTQDTNFVFIKK